MEFEDVIRKREATRKFSDKEVEQSKIDKILEAGRLAPTAKNIQPIKIYVIKDRIDSIDKASRCRYNAPVAFIICADLDEAFSDGVHSTSEIDASIVTTHMMLEATNVGLDNVWVELFDKEIVKDEFNMGDNILPVALLPVGYRADDCPDSPRHNIRKNIEELVEYY